MSNCNCGQTVSKTGEIIHECHQYENAPPPTCGCGEDSECKECDPYWGMSASDVECYDKGYESGWTQSRQATLDEAIEKIAATPESETDDHEGLTIAIDILQGMKQ